MGRKNTHQHFYSQAQSENVHPPFWPKSRFIKYQNQGKSSPPPNLEPPIVFTSLLHSAYRTNLADKSSLFDIFKY